MLMCNHQLSITGYDLLGTDGREGCDMHGETKTANTLLRVLPFRKGVFLKKMTFVDIRHLLVLGALCVLLEHNVCSAGREM